MSLFAGLLLEDDTTSAAKPLPQCMVYIKRASNGVDILLCSVTPPTATALAEAKQRNLALFTTDEIPAMRQAGASDPRYIDAMIETRRLMGWGGPIAFKVTA